MIKSPAAFPHPGSFALLEADGDTHLVRVIVRDGGRATISFPLRTGASGNTQVEVARLLDATPLTAAEAEELTDLERKLAGKARPKRADLQREQALRFRWCRSHTMQQLKEKAVRLKYLDRQTAGLPEAIAA